MRTLIYFFTYFLMNSCFSQLDTNKNTNYKSQAVIPSNNKKDSLKSNQEVPDPLICTLKLEKTSFPYTKENALKEVSENQLTYVVDEVKTFYNRFEIYKFEVKYNIKIKSIGVVFPGEVNQKELDKYNKIMLKAIVKKHGEHVKTELLTLTKNT